MNYTPNFVSIVVSYVPASACKGSRIKLTLSLTGKSRFLPYDHAFNSCEDTAIAFLREAGAEPLGRTSLPSGGDVALLYAFANFEIIKTAIGKR